MPSVLIGGAVSGVSANFIISGNPWSGQLEPVGGIQLFASPVNSGSIYVGFSGGITINSGGNAFSSGGALTGLLDGTPVAAGAAYFVPRLATNNNRGNTSGSFQLFAVADAACSGQGRLYFEVF